jgi:hypothetical protein
MIRPNAAKSKGSAPNAESGKEVALGVSLEVVRPDIGNAPVVHVAVDGSLVGLIAIADAGFRSLGLDGFRVEITSTSSNRVCFPHHTGFRLNDIF